MRSTNKKVSSLNTQLIEFGDNNAVLGNSLVETCERLRKLSLRNFQLAQSRKDDPNVLPISKYQFLKALEKNSDSKATSLREVATNLIKHIKSQAVVGLYGRFSTLITEAEMIPCGETLIYLSKGKAPGELPPKKYIHSKTKKDNPLVTAMSGSKEGWLDFIDNQSLSIALKDFYNANKKELDLIMKDLVFLDRYESFFIPDRMRDFTLKLPGNQKQQLCIFESNASSIRGGQWMITAPSGFLHGGYVEQSLKKQPKKPPGSLSPLKRSNSSPNLSRQSIFSKKSLNAIQADESCQMMMEEHGEYIFLLATQLDSNYLIIQNPRDTASVSVHFHCYIVNKAEQLEQKGVQQSLPLLNAPVVKKLFDHTFKNFHLHLEKLQWTSPCYRLVVPANSSLSEFHWVANYIMQVQNATLKAKPHCSFSFLAQKRNDMIEFYFGLRKCVRQSMMPNAIAIENQLQSPYNGTFEFAGLSNMQDQKEFDQYKAAYEKDKIQAKQLFIAIQNYSLGLSTPDAKDILDFEQCLLTHASKPFAGVKDEKIMAENEESPNEGYSWYIAYR